MSSSNVRNIDSLVTFRGGILRLSHDWDKILQEIRLSVQRVEQYFVSEQPRYWRRQTQLAERELAEAKDNLSQKRATVRANDRPPATEAVKRVNNAKRRLEVCRAKVRLSKSIAIEMSKQCDELLGPLADVAEQCEVLLPGAANELKTLIAQLQAYAEQHDPNS